MSKSTSPLKILLVDDVQLDAALIQTHLDQSGIHLSLEIETTLESAVGRLKKTRFDVVLLDLMLSDSQGPTTLKLLRAAADHTPIIVLTAIEDPEFALQTLSDGAQDYLIKSKITADSLSRAIHYTLERSRRERAEGELAAAGVIQRRLFPRGAPKVPGFDVNGRCVQATFAGGDFFDFFAMGKQHLGVVIADVAGHGIGPAITMSETRAVIRAFATVTHDVGEILTRSGALLARDFTKETFVAIFLARIDIVRHSLQYATAGHPGFILTPAGRTKKLLKTDDPPLGIDGSTVFHTSIDIPLDPGDSLLLFTDGFAEAENVAGERFGRQRVFDTVRKHCTSGADVMLHQLFDHLKDFRGETPPDDDVTAVVVRASAPVRIESPNEADSDDRQKSEMVAHAEFEHFEADKRDDISVLRLRDVEILSSQQCSEVRAELVSYLKNEKPARVVISFASVKRFSSEGINICFQIKSLLDGMDGQLRLCEMHPQLREAFKALNLDGTVFEIYDEIGKALHSFLTKT